MTISTNAGQPTCLTTTAQGNKKISSTRINNTMLQLNKQLQGATLEHQQGQLKQRIAFTDKKIDTLVYELYGLSEEEVKIL